MSARDGGPAFPSQTDLFIGHVGTQSGARGMTVRDYFAAKAMAALIEKVPLLKHALLDDGSARGASDEQLRLQREGIARSAYAQADAMLAAREAQL